MTEFVTPALQADGNIVDQLDWNGDLGNNLVALHERAPVGYPYKQVANTTTEIELLAHPVPANALGTRGFVQAELAGVLQNNSGATRQAFLRLYVDTTIILAASVSVAAGANRTVLRTIFRIQNLNNFAQQLVTVEHFFGASPTPAGTIQSLSSNGQWQVGVIDTSVDRTLRVVGAWDAAAVSCVFDIMAAHVIGPITKT